LGELWSTNQKLIDAYVEEPNWTFFLETIIRPLGGGGWPLKFLHTLQLPKMYFNFVPGAPGSLMLSSAPYF